MQLPKSKWRRLLEAVVVGLGGRAELAPCHAMPKLGGNIHLLIDFDGYRGNKMVNSSNAPAAKLLAWSADRIRFNITKN